MLGAESSSGAAAAVAVGDLVWVYAGRGVHVEPGVVRELNCALDKNENNNDVENNTNNTGIRVKMIIAGYEGIYPPTHVVLRESDNNDDGKDGRRRSKRPRAPVVAKAAAAAACAPDSKRISSSSSSKSSYSSSSSSSSNSKIQTRPVKNKKKQQAKATATAAAAAVAVVTPPPSSSSSRKREVATNSSSKKEGKWNDVTSPQRKKAKSVALLQKEDSPPKEGTIVCKDIQKSNKNNNSDSEEVVEEEWWEVEDILQRRMVKGREQFFVKYKGEEPPSWQPQENLCDSAIRAARSKLCSGKRKSGAVPEQNDGMEATEEEEEEKDELNGEVVCVDMENSGYFSDDEDEQVLYFAVEKIIKRRFVRGQEQFLVKWVGHNKATWEPEENLCDSAIEEARMKFCDNQDGKEDDDIFTLTTSAHILENFAVERLPGIEEGEVVWHNSPTMDTSVNFAYLFPPSAGGGGGGEVVTRKRSFRKNNAPKVLELFAGVGGMSLGLQAAEFDTKWVVEKNALACARQQLLHPDAFVYSESVEEFLQKATQGHAGYPRAEEVDHVHASPPCQGFSKANRWGGKSVENNTLSYAFASAVRHFRPVTATMENVEGMFQTKHMPFLRKIISKLIRYGYQVRISLLNASNYGVPQRRKRVFLFAALKGWPLPDIPPATHGDRDGLKPKVTVRDVLSDLEEVSPEGGPGLVSAGLVSSGDSHLMFNHVVSENMLLSGNIPNSERIDPDNPCETILTSNRIVHYSIDRHLSVREIARLMTFPDSFRLFGQLSEQYTQLGNAVPVKLAAAVAQSVAVSYGK